MSTDSTSSFLQSAKSNLKKVSTRDETKEHGYLGRVVSETSHTRPSPSAAAFQSARPSTEKRTTSVKTLGGDFSSRAATESTETGRRSEDEMKSGATGTEDKIGQEKKPETRAGETRGMTGFHEKAPQEDFGFIDEEDLNAQIRIIEEDISNITKKLKLSADRLNKHQIRKEQNMSLQKELGLKATEMRHLAEQKNKEKMRALEQEYEMEKKRSEFHRLAQEHEIERARSIALEKTNLDFQKVALRRAEEHERGIQFSKALKERYEYQIKILQTQKELLEFEKRMKDVFSSVPLMNFEPVYIKHEINPEKLEERRITTDFPSLEKKTISGVYDGESGTIGDFDTKLQDINYNIKY